MTETKTATGRIGAESSDTATIGASTYIKGQIRGDDDLVVRGRVEGKIRLPKNRVVVAKESSVKADIVGRSIEVEGHVKGTLNGGDEVRVRAGGRVEGDIVAPRVTLDSGAQFSGMVDMEGGKKPPAAAEA